ncbi:5-carboxymethyl-2-hydroxymuconate Delta-isomerase [Variovorax sp. RA8]|uniref:5-carboxymethyl-2-hydroxymuconate Delta-isomerase n=1 Tax=Variovorax sp. (strain JCM 16519 / RA8) TaxID=662548 RepID=UPI000AAEDEEB|nr:5-carboxymethyl-2-hydroxymuconate Delta-isomerase [Variovorax sp. RA8]VTU14022.1 5-carboxymethyl-2-hydroxymuconate Delta-isomerase [Variovorax sp. RA8]
MPHLVILYTPDVEADADMPALCRALADTMIEQRDDQDRPVFPIGGTRVLAYPAAHFAVADGSGEHGFVYLNLRMAAGRSDAVKKRVGDALLARLKRHAEPLLAKRHVGITLQIDEAPGQVYDGKCGNLHPLFQP